MKLIIAGGRDFRPRECHFEWLYKLLTEIDITEIVSGKCSGADEFGASWARFHGLEVKEFPADWNKHGRSAGPIRNREMAQYADAVVLFPGGRGTDSMYKEAVRAGLKIHDWRSRK